MLNSITPTEIEHTATITGKGQITIPASVRRHLKLAKHQRIAFVVEPSGAVTLKAPKYPTLESLAGSVPPLKTPMSWKEMEKVIADDRAEAYMAKMSKNA